MIIFQPSYYCYDKKTKSSVSDNSSDTVINVENSDAAVRIRGLTKVFKRFRGEADFILYKIEFNANVLFFVLGRTNVAVNNLSMDILKNQITVLLGHNGAGKTTTMSMISGIIPKTAGSITVDGEENIDVYRQKIGYCPQHNVYMSYFTCADHLWFFGRVSVSKLKS